MRKVKLQMQVSIDGFVAGPNGAMDWMVWDWDEELKNYVNALTDPVDTILLGRNLAEGFIPHWTALTEDPATADAFSKKMVDTPKVVFTHTIKESPWNHTVIAEEPLAECVHKLKEETGGDIIAYGGGSFITSMIENNLIDDYYLFINPVALGSGMTIFKNDKGYTKLRLAETKGFSCGITLLHYQPA